MFGSTMCTECNMCLGLQCVLSVACVRSTMCTECNVCFGLQRVLSVMCVWAYHLYWV